MESRCRTRSWKPTVRRPGDVVDLQPEMYRLALEVAARSLFSTEIGDRAAELNRSLSEALRWTGRLTFPLSGLWRGLPLSWLRSYHSNVRFLRATVDEIVEERRRLVDPPDDLFALLLQAQADGAEHLTDELVSDEIVTLLFAGHETTASTLTWACLLLAFHPEAQEAAHAELDRVVGDETASPAHLEKLDLIGQVVHETLRLYPPVWLFGRRAIEELELGAFSIRKGSVLLLSPWVSHRDERWWPQPEAFDLDRWTPKARAERPATPSSRSGRAAGLHRRRLRHARSRSDPRARALQLAPPPRRRRPARPAPWMTLRPGGPCRVRLEARR